MNTNEPDDQQSNTLNDSESTQLPPFIGLTGAALLGLATVIKQLERCPRAAQVVERLIYAGMTFTLLMALIRYGHKLT